MVTLATKMVRAPKINKSVLLRSQCKKEKPGRFCSMITPRPHTSNITKAAIREIGWDVIPRPSYSPDLALSDFHLFSKMIGKFFTSK